jgi:hypothetical protein
LAGFGGVLPSFFKSRNNVRRLFLKTLIVFPLRRRSRKTTRNQRPSLRCQFHLAVVRGDFCVKPVLLANRSTATLIEPGVSQTFGPTVFTGRGPLQERFKDAEVGIAQPVRAMLSACGIRAWKLQRRATNAGPVSERRFAFH